MPHYLHVSEPSPCNRGELVHTSSRSQVLP